MFMSVHKGEGGVKIVPNPVHVVCECPPSAMYLALLVITKIIVYYDSS